MNHSKSSKDSTGSIRFGVFWGRNRTFTKNEKKSRSPQPNDIKTKIACSSEEKQTILAGEEGFEMSKINSIDSIEEI